MFRKYVIGIFLLSVSGYSQAMDRNLEAAKEETISTAAQKIEIKIFVNKGRENVFEDYSIGFNEELLNFLHHHCYPARHVLGKFYMNVSRNVLTNIEKLCTALDVYTQWKENRAEAELLLLDIFYWGEENKALLNELRTVETLKESFSKQSGIILAHGHPETMIAPAMAAYFDIGSYIGTKSGALYNKENQETNFAPQVFIFFKKLFHFMHNLHKDYNVPFEVLNADNLTDLNKEVLSKKFFDDRFKGNSDEIVDLLVRYIQSQKLVDSDYFFDVLELATHWHLRTLVHALVRLLRDNVTLDTVDEVIEALPLHVYPQLLKNRENAVFVMRLLNSVITKKSKQISTHNYELDMTAEQKAIVDDCLDCLVDCIECLYLQRLPFSLHPRLERDLHERFNKKIPLGRKTVVCDLSNIFTPKKRIVAAFNGRESLLVYCQDGRSYEFLHRKPQIFQVTPSNIPFNYAMVQPQNTNEIIYTDDHGVFYLPILGVFYLPNPNENRIFIMPIKMRANALNYYKKSHMARGLITNICAGFKDGSVVVFDAHKGKTVTFLENPAPGKPCCVKIAAHYTLIVAVFDDSTFKIWNTDDFKLVSQGKVPSPVKKIHFFGKGIVFGCTDGAYIYDIEQKSYTQVPINEEITACDQMRDKHLILGTKNGNVYAWNSETNKAFLITKGKLHSVLITANDVDCEITVVFAHGRVEKYILPELRSLKDIDLLALGEYFYAQKNRQAYVRAFRCFEQSYESNRQAAAARIGEMSFYGRGCTVDLKKALMNLYLGCHLHASDLVAAETAVSIAEIALKCEGFEKILKTGKESFVSLCHEAADRYFSSKNKQEKTHLIKFYQICAELGNPWLKGWAIYRLGELFYLGEAIWEDIDKARDCFQKAAAQSACRKAQVDALRILLHMCEHGIGVKRDADQIAAYKVQLMEVEHIIEHAARTSEETQKNDSTEICDDAITPVTQETDEGGLLKDPVGHLTSAAGQSINKAAKARASLYLLKLGLFGLKGVKLSANEFHSYIAAAYNQDVDLEVKAEAEMIDTLMQPKRLTFQH